MVFTKPNLVFFFFVRKKLLQKTHDEAQDPKGKQCAPHAYYDHCDSKRPIIHNYLPPENIASTLYHHKNRISIKK
jgi:hypothetical protein